MTTYDAIVIPGGGVREGGELPSWVRCRLDRAVQLHRSEYIVTLSAGTPYRPPPLDANAFPIFESTAGARYLIDSGVPADQVLTETCSYDTIGNAFFLRLIHAEPRAFQNLLVITSDFHMPRTRAIFDWMFALPPKTLTFQVDYESVPDPDMPAELLADRRQKEQRSLDNFSHTKNSITTIQACHQWLFTRHDAYKATGFSHPLLKDAGALKSY